MRVKDVELGLRETSRPRSSLSPSSLPCKNPQKPIDFLLFEDPYQNGRKLTLGSRGRQTEICRRLQLPGPHALVERNELCSIQVRASQVSSQGAKVGKTPRSFLVCGGALRLGAHDQGGLEHRV